MEETDRQDVQFVMKVLAVGLVVPLGQSIPIFHGLPKREVGAQYLA